MKKRRKHSEQEMRSLYDRYTTESIRLKELLAEAKISRSVFSRWRRKFDALKAVLRSIYDTLGPYPGYRTVMEALHARGYKRGQSLTRELIRTCWLPEREIK